MFWDLHRSEILRKYKPKLVIGQVAESDKKKASGPNVDTIAGEISLGLCLNFCFSKDWSSNAVTSALW